MSVFYIKYQPTSSGVMDTLELTATTRVSRTEQSEVTSNIIETGSYVSDHVINKGSVVTFEGVITDISSIIHSPSSKIAHTTEEYLSELQRIRDEKQFFTVYCGDTRKATDSRGAQTSFNRIDNCLFESFTVSQDQTHGVVLGRRNNARSYKVSFKAKQVRVAEAARDVEVKVPDSSVTVTAAEQTFKETSVIGTLLSYNPLLSLAGKPFKSLNFFGKALNPFSSINPLGDAFNPFD